MDDLISRRAAMDALRKTMLGFFQTNNDDEPEFITASEKMLLSVNRVISKALKDLPSAQPKKGKNIYNTVKGHCEFKCSVCGAEAHIVEGGELDGGYFNFCPNCGADMRGGQEEKEYVR